VYTGQPTGTPNWTPPNVTFWAVLGPDVVGGVDKVVVVVLVDATVDEVVLVLVLAVWRPRAPGVETFGPEPPPHAASNRPPNAATANTLTPFEC
jgi:hypothetical protein